MIPNTNSPSNPFTRFQKEQTFHEKEVVVIAGQYVAATLKTMLPGLKVENSSSDFSVVESKGVAYVFVGSNLLRKSSPQKQADMLYRILIYSMAASVRFVYFLDNKCFGDNRSSLKEVLSAFENTFPQNKTDISQKLACSIAFVLGNSVANTPTKEECLASLGKHQCSSAFMKALLKEVTERGKLFFPGDTMAKVLESCSPAPLAQWRRKSKKLFLEELLNADEQRQLHSILMKRTQIYEQILGEALGALKEKFALEEDSEREAMIKQIAKILRKEAIEPAKVSESRPFDSMMSSMRLCRSLGKLLDSRKNASDSSDYLKQLTSCLAEDNFFSLKAETSAATPTPNGFAASYKECCFTGLGKNLLVAESVWPLLEDSSKQSNTDLVISFLEGSLVEMIKFVGNFFDQWLSDQTSKLNPAELLQYFLEIRLMLEDVCKACTILNEHFERTNQLADKEIMETFQAQVQSAALRVKVEIGNKSKKMMNKKQKIELAEEIDHLTRAVEKNLSNHVKIEACSLVYGILAELCLTEKNYLKAVRLFQAAFNYHSAIKAAEAWVHIKFVQAQTEELREQEISDFRTILHLYFEMGLHEQALKDCYKLMSVARANEKEELVRLFEDVQMEPSNQREAYLGLAIIQNLQNPPLLSQRELDQILASLKA